MLQLQLFTKLSISLLSITKSHFPVTKDVRLNTAYVFTLKIQNKGKLQQIASNHSSDTYFADFKMLYRIFTADSY